MKVAVVEYGGFAATLRPRPLVIDADGLSPQDALALTALVSEAEASEGEKVAGARAVPDAITYRVTIDRSDRSVVLEGSDTDSSPAFRALVNFVRGQTKS